MQENRSAISNVIWRFLERCGAQAVSFVVSIILARLLSPDDYGTIALVMVFIALLNVFVDGGFGNSLIQKKNADDLDFSSVFYFNILICVVLYFIMFFSAPYIAEFYNRSDLTSVIRVLSLILIISGVKNIQQAYISKKLLFKKFFYSTLIGTIGAAIIGITMAYLGYGVWALVAQQLFNTAVDSLVLWITVDWRPKKLFSFDRLKSLVSYGWKFLASNLLNTGYDNLRSLIIGKLYSPSDLAYYDKGKRYPYLITSNVNTSIDSVLLPTMSLVQDDREEVKEITRRSIKLSIFIMAPLMMGLAFTSNKVIPFLLTDKWSFCVPYLCVFCICYMFYPIHTSNLNAIKALGRSDLFLKLEIVKKAMDIILILITMRISVWAMCISEIVSSIGSQIINSWPNKKLLNYSYTEQLKDIAPSVLLAVFMGIIVYVVGLINLPTALSLIIQVSIGAVIYIIGAKILKNDSYEYIINLLKDIKKDKKIGK